jgi:uncharacterized membrane protein YdjX (TVP38/TMEM64 family)
MDRAIGRVWPLLVLAALLALAAALGLFRAVSVEALAAHRQGLAGFVAARPAEAAAVYLLAHAAIVALAVPVGPLLTIAGGTLFGQAMGLALAVPAATLGSSLLFLAVRHALAPGFARHAGPRLDRLREGLRRDGFWYLLSVRLLPFMPYAIGSAAPALAGMRLAPFVAATAIGITPANAVFAGIGAGLDAAFAGGLPPALGVVLTPALLLPLLVLALLPLAVARLARLRLRARTGTLRPAPGEGRE